MVTGSTRRPPQASLFRVPRSSTVDLIAAQLRDAIYSGALPVGSPIGEVEISTQLGVSRSPLREATQRLVQEGLLTATPGRGLRVSVIDKQHLDDLYDARAAVETQAVRLLARDRDEVALQRLDTTLAALEAVSTGEDARAIGDADLEFHRTLVACAGNRRLTRFMATLAIETRIASFSMAEGYIVRRDVSDSYRVLLDALHAGDATTAEEALRRQFDEAVARMRGTLAPRDSPDVDTLEAPAAHEPQTLEPLDVTRGERP